MPAIHRLQAKITLCFEYNVDFSKYEGLVFDQERHDKSGLVVDQERTVFSTALHHPTIEESFHALLVLMGKHNQGLKPDGVIRTQDMRMIVLGEVEELKQG